MAYCFQIKDFFRGTPLKDAFGLGDHEDLEGDGNIIDQCIDLTSNLNLQNLPSHPGQWYSALRADASDAGLPTSLDTGDFKFTMNSWINALPVEEVEKLARDLLAFGCINFHFNLDCTELVELNIRSWYM